MAEEFKGKIEVSYQASTPWWPEKETLTHKDAPNVVYIVMDDAGFSDAGCYGSMIDTPNIDGLAADGLRYQNFHVNPMCSPTRASLLSGCNCHSVGMGFLANWDLGFPGYRGSVGKEYGLISDALSESGYSTFALGKWHLINSSLMTAAGPFDQWPLGRGFDKYYGFLDACTDQFNPTLVCGNEYVRQPKPAAAGYHLSEDLVDHAIGYIGDTISNDPDKPFFCYLAFGAQHAPHQAPQKYIDMYRGKFDDGWAAYRRKVFEKQKKLGIVPENAALTDDDRFVREWDAFTPDEQKVLAKYMEVYAGFLTHTDAQIGRLMDYLKEIDQYNNTLVVFLMDNGASAEGSPVGADSVGFQFAAEQDVPIISLKDSEKLGTVRSSCAYPAGWAHACNTPLKMYKSWSHNGGIKVPLIISYPNGIKDRGGIRTQYHHVIDIYKTVEEVCGFAEPKTIRGIPQQPKQGVSMAYTFDHPDEKSHRSVQYYEMVGNRGIWADGWKAVADHALAPAFDFSQDHWELYHTDEDFSENVDLADKYPEKLREMIDLWFDQAGRYNVLPLGESHLKKMEGFNSKTIFKFKPTAPRSEYVYYPQVTACAVPPLRGSFTMTASAEYRPGDEGVLVSAGGAHGGYALYIHAGELVFDYNFFTYRHYTFSGALTGLAAGVHAFALRFGAAAPDRGAARLLVDGRELSAMELKCKPLFATSFGSFSVGSFSNNPVNDALNDTGCFPFTGHIKKVTVRLDSAPVPAGENEEVAKEERRQ